MKSNAFGTAPVRGICGLIFLLGLMSLLSCGGSATQSPSQTPTPPPATVDLTTTMTTPALDATVPATTAANIAQVLSSADSQPVGTPLAIPTSSVGFPTPLFAVDSGGKPLLAAYATSGTTTLSASSTATTLVTLTLGLPTTSLSYSQLTQDIQKASDYSTLATDIQASLSTGTSPLDSQTVSQDVANVVNEVLTVVAPQPSSATASAAHPSASSHLFRQQHAHTSLPPENAAPPLPFQILGPFAWLPTFYSVYIASPTSQGGVNLINTMPIQFHASSQDKNSNAIDGGETLPAADIIFGLVPLKPQAVGIQGNGQTFTVTVDETDLATQKVNVNQVLTDWLIFAIGQVTNINANLPGLQACAQQGSKELLNAIINANTSIFIPLSTGADVAQSVAVALSGNIMFSALKTVITCSAPGIAASAAASAAIANLAKFVVPLSGVWKVLQFVASASGPLTETGLMFYYWNDSQDVNVCEDNGSLAPCGGFWAGSYSVSTCNTPGYVGSGDPCSYIVWSLSLGSAGFGSRTARLYVGPNQANNVRYEQQFDAEFCSAGSGVDLTTAGSWEDTEDLTNVFLSGVHSTTLTFTITQRSPTLVSGTFAGSFEYPVSSSGTAQGQIAGQWSLTPLSAAFPKCITNGYEWCYVGGSAVNAVSNTGTGSCPFLDPAAPAPPGEWQ
jgi:hypothetical protein